MAAHTERDELAEADIEATWRSRLRRVLLADPEAAEELRLLLAELDPGAQSEPPASVHNTISGGVQNGPVFQGQHFSRLTFGGSGAVPSEQGDGAM
ncbi:hypothetical protein [Streptomyces sp. NPDC088847]|uniref:hypothetical protein n=1 Tax=Streptomyces sp. NPDC088847 TaxID=3365909 RepID=UPI00382C976C